MGFTAVSNRSYSPFLQSISAGWQAMPGREQEILSVSRRHVVHASLHSIHLGWAAEKASDFTSSRITCGGAGPNSVKAPSRAMKGTIWLNFGK